MWLHQPNLSLRILQFFSKVKLKKNSTSWHQYLIYNYISLPLALKAFILNWFSFFFLCFLAFSRVLILQIIIQNLTTYSIYTVNVQAASSSIINPRRILLGSHSTSRKVSHTYVIQSKNSFRKNCVPFSFTLQKH